GMLGRALVGFEPDNPDALGYLLPAIAALAVLAAAGVAALASLSAWAALPVALVALALPFVQVARFAGPASFPAGDAPDPYPAAARRRHPLVLRDPLPRGGRAEARGRAARRDRHRPESPPPALRTGGRAPALSRSRPPGRRPTPRRAADAGRRARRPPPAGRDG